MTTKDKSDPFIKSMYLHTDAAADEAAALADLGFTPVDVDGNGQALLLNATEGKGASTNALVFNSGDEITTTALALHKRSEDLRALAKKSREMGKLREATAIEREATHIAEFLLPQVRTQIEAPFDDAEELIDALTRTVGGTIRRATSRSLRLNKGQWPDELDEDYNARCRQLMEEYETIVGGIAENAAAAVLPFLEQCAEMAYAAGLEARNGTPAVLARRAVQRTATLHSE